MSVMSDGANPDENAFNFVGVLPGWWTSAHAPKAKEEEGDGVPQV